jgi:hypothetical protein
MIILYVAKGITIYKINQIISKKLPIMIVYTNELNWESHSIVEVVFHVAKQEGGRGGWHIHRVYGMSLLAKSQFS